MVRLCSKHASLPCLLLPLVLAACGSSSTSVYHSADHTFSLTYPGAWQTTVQQTPGSPAPDVDFSGSASDGTSTVLITVRSEPNPQRLSPKGYIVHRILHVPAGATSLARSRFSSLNARPITVHHAPGWSYSTAGGSPEAVEAVVVAARGRMYLLFAFGREGQQHVSDLLRSFQFS